MLKAELDLAEFKELMLARIDNSPYDSSRELKEELQQQRVDNETSISELRYAFQTIKEENRTLRAQITKVKEDACNKERALLREIMQMKEQDSFGKPNTIIFPTGTNDLHSQRHRTAEAIRKDLYDGLHIHKDGVKKFARGLKYVALGRNPTSSQPRPPYPFRYPPPPFMQSNMPFTCWPPSPKHLHPSPHHKATPQPRKKTPSPTKASHPPERHQSYAEAVGQPTAAPKQPSELGEIKLLLHVQVFSESFLQYQPLIPGSSSRSFGLSHRRQ
ncbi:unnamed protein product [Gadus morhua 'NCC']